MRDHKKLRAFGSLRELNYQLNLAMRLGFLKSDMASKVEDKVKEAEKVLNGLLRSIREK